MKKFLILMATIAFSMTAIAQKPALMSASFNKETKILAVELDNGATTVTSFKFIFRLPEGVGIKSVYDEEEEEDVLQVLRVKKRVSGSSWTFDVRETTGEKAGATAVTCFGGTLKNPEETKNIVTIELTGEMKGTVQFTEAQIMMDGVETDLADFVYELPDAINSITADETKSGIIYNVAGQRVSKAAKGVYVIDGKKYVVK